LSHEAAPTSFSGDVVQISGQHIYQESGAIVLISGQEVSLASGAVVQVSGAHVYVESGAVVQVSGQTLELESGTGPIQVYGELQVSGVVLQVSGAVVLVSGQVVQVSGQHIYQESGAYVITSVSGDVLTVIQSGTLVVTASGDVYEPRTPTAGRIRATLALPTASGGAALESGVVISITTKALSTNSGDIYLGFSTEPPYSGYGFLLEPGENTSMDMDNFNKVRGVAEISGDKVSYYGIVY